MERLWCLLKFLCLALVLVPLHGCGFFTDGYTSTVLSSSAISAAYETSIVLTAKVYDENNKLLTSASGTVAFYVDSTEIGTGTLSDGAATYTTASLAVGTHTVYAVFEGASPYQASVSDDLTVVISSSLTSTTTTLSASATTLTSGSTLTLSAAVGISAATGTVTFYDDTSGTPVVLGTTSLSGGTASLSLNTLTAGSHILYATYIGDSVYASSTSGSITVTVNASS